MADEISVEVAFALPDKQWLVELRLPGDASVEEAIRHSGLLVHARDYIDGDPDAGIWGKPVKPTQRLRDGDRVELYRPLLIDPREARRRLAHAGQTMREDAAH